MSEPKADLIGWDLRYDDEETKTATVEAEHEVEHITIHE